jgi:hypothetical protein
VLGGRERHIRKGTATGSSGVRGLPVMPDNKRRYFRLPNDTKIRCFTKYFQWRDGSSFICYEQYDGESGLDELTRIKTNIDISIDESRNTYIPDDGSGKQSYHFRDY